MHAAKPGLAMAQQTMQITSRPVLVSRYPRRNAAWSHILVAGGMMQAFSVSLSYNCPKTSQTVSLFIDIEPIDNSNIDSAA